ncbi:MAG TPA: pseudouridine-5'-phosphate glycosidase [Geminicoccaceae bacterium]|nr:pseudouridine-5'-phosphate glycosidase [Geminicoccaceae bacterium]
MTIELLPEVANALAHGQGVVALESTLICHGLPRPHNATVAIELEQAVREQGAVPATVAAIDGQVNVGLSRAALARLVKAPEVAKCTTRDLPRVLVGGELGATTIAATIFIASQVGISVMATGGLGGVHRGGEHSMDISADLDELARRPVVVVCSGVKSILDQRRTLERLETLGVPVIGYRCRELPGFYTAETGLPVPSVDDVSGLCRLVRAHDGLGLPGGLVVVQPPPPEDALSKDAVDQLVAAAQAAAAAAGVDGPAQTPFMLGHMAEHSQGVTVQVNRALVRANARLAGAIAATLAGMSGPD